MKDSQRKAMFAKRQGHFNRTFVEDVEKEIRMALAKKYNGVRKTSDGSIRIGFDNMKHVDIKIIGKEPT